MSQVDVLSALSPIGVRRLDKAIKQVAVGIDPTSERLVKAYAPFRTRLKRIRREKKPSGRGRGRPRKSGKKEV